MRHLSRTLVWVLGVGSGACVLPANRDGGAAHPTVAFFTPAQARMAAPLFVRRVAEQAEPRDLTADAERLHFTLESDSVDYKRFGRDRVNASRREFAVPMGIVSGNLAVLTPRCLIDHKYPDPHGEGANFTNLALFNDKERLPRQVFMLAPVPHRDDLTRTRDPASAHWFFTDRYYLGGAAGDRYFGPLSQRKIAGVGAQLLSGSEWESDRGIDLVMLYFPLTDPAVAALRPSENLQLADPIGSVNAAMAGRTDYLGFEFAMITPNCLHSMEQEADHLRHEASLWKHVALGEAAIVLLAVLGPAAAGAGGLGGFTTTVATTLEAVGQTVGPKILTGLPSLAWHVVRRTLSGEQLGDVVWDEGGHLIVGSVIDGVPRRLLVAGVQRGTADNVTAERVVATVREFVRERPAQLLIQYAAGHADVASLIRDDVGVDLSSELLAAGLVALDANDRTTLARQQTLIRAAAFALQGNRGPAVLDPQYQATVQQLALVSGS